MIMDSCYPTQQHQQDTVSPNIKQHAELHIITTSLQTPQSPSSMNNNNNNETLISPSIMISSSKKPALKRSFDVAFLMMPDERIKQKQDILEARHIDIRAFEHQYPTDLSPRSQQIPLQLHTSLPDQNEFFQLHELRRYPQINLRSPRIYDDPTVVLPSSTNSHTDVTNESSLPLKSAFTKVASYSNINLMDPSPHTAPPLSPDQHSCPSLSPPLSSTPPRTNSTGNGSVLNSGSAQPMTVCRNHNNIIYQGSRPDYQFNGTSFQNVNHIHAMQAHRFKQQLLYRSPKVAIITSSTTTASGSPQTVQAVPVPANTRTEPAPAYQGFRFVPRGAHFNPIPSPELPCIVQNPAAAAILSTLIPPTLASTFTLTAQNVCAKCNISFRMTSDLVYHMRSHHKNEVTCDPNRRKREEKLRCPVCQETFRERHHLTRHMTAHQDKESDQVQPTPIKLNSFNTNNKNVTINVKSANERNTIREDSCSERQLHGVSACGTK